MDLTVEGQAVEEWELVLVKGMLPDHLLRRGVLEEKELQIMGQTLQIRLRQICLLVVMVAQVERVK